MSLTKILRTAVLSAAAATAFNATPAKAQAPETCTLAISQYVPVHSVLVNSAEWIRGVLTPNDSPKPLFYGPEGKTELATGRNLAARNLTPEQQNTCQQLEDYLKIKAIVYNNGSAPDTVEVNTALGQLTNVQRRQTTSRIQIVPFNAVTGRVAEGVTITAPAGYALEDGIVWPSEYAKAPFQGEAKVNLRELTGGNNCTPICGATVDIEFTSSYQPTPSSTPAPGSATPAPVATAPRSLDEISVRETGSGTTILLNNLNNFTGEIEYYADDCWAYDAKPSTQIFEGTTRGAAGEPNSNLLEEEKNKPSYLGMGGTVCATELDGRDLTLRANTNYQGADRVTTVRFIPKQAYIPPTGDVTDTGTGGNPLPVPTITPPKEDGPGFSIPRPAETANDVYLNLTAGGIWKHTNIENGWPRNRSFEQDHKGISAEASAVVNKGLFHFEGGITHARYSGKQTSDNTQNLSELRFDSTAVNAYGLVSPFIVGAAAELEHSRVNQNEDILKNEREPIPPSTPITRSITTFAGGIGARGGAWNGAVMYAQRNQPDAYAWDEKATGIVARLDYHGPLANQDFSFSGRVERLTGEETPIGNEYYANRFRFGINWQPKDLLGIGLVYDQTTSDSVEYHRPQSLSLGISVGTKR